MDVKCILKRKSLVMLGQAEMFLQQEGEVMYLVMFGMGTIGEGEGRSVQVVG